MPNPVMSMKTVMTITRVGESPPRVWLLVLKSIAPRASYDLLLVEDIALIFRRSRVDIRNTCWLA